MTKHRYLALAALAGWLAAAAAHAQEGFAYFGFKAGRMEADAAGFDTASNIGFTLGYNLVEDFNGAIALEAEYTRNLAAGDVTRNGENGDWRIETIAGYAAYRTPGDFYVKARAGLLRRDVKVGTISAPEISGKENELSFGVGLGGRFNYNAGLELEYTFVDSDIGFVSLGYFTYF